MDFSLSEALLKPDETINKYKDVAIKEGTRMLLLQAVTFSVLTYALLSLALKQNRRRNK